MAAGPVASNDVFAPARLTVGIVSAGRVGSALGAALEHAGHVVFAVAAISDESVRRARQRLPDSRILPAPAVAAGSELLILAVPDTELPGLIAGLVAADAVLPGTIVAHTSGAHGVSVLTPLADRGARALALHPAMTFTGHDEDLTRLRSCCFGVTGADEVGYAIGQSLVIEMGAEPVRVLEQHRSLYHAALAHGSNHVVAVTVDATTALAAALSGPDREPDRWEATRVLGPLATAALENALHHGSAALTGPVARGDGAAVDAHLQALAELDSHLAAAYRAMSLRAAQQVHADTALLDLLTSTAPAGEGVRASHPGDAALPVAPSQGQAGEGAACLVHEPAQLTARVVAARAAGQQVGLVPTMGALHAGHLALVRQAQCDNDIVVVSIFVNPLQFGGDEDLASYPRNLDRDVALLREQGVGLVFAPSAAALYPEGPRTTVSPGPLGSDLEGAARPQHFAGVLTVVAKLLEVARPHRAYFGEKDYQQLVLIRQLVQDLNIEVAIEAVPTVRESDGLAMSSRNTYLDAGQRIRAALVSTALTAGARAAPRGGPAAVAAAAAVLADAPEIHVDYLQLRAPDLAPAPATGPARLLVAVRIGCTRLIDNVPVALGAPTGKEEGRG